MNVVQQDPFLTLSHAAEYVINCTQSIESSLPTHEQRFRKELNWKREFSSCGVECEKRFLSDFHPVLGSQIHRGWKEPLSIIDVPEDHDTSLTGKHRCCSRRCLPQLLLILQPHSPTAFSCHSLGRSSRFDGFWDQHVHGTGNTLEVLLIVRLPEQERLKSKKMPPHSRFLRSGPLSSSAQKPREPREGWVLGTVRSCCHFLVLDTSESSRTNHHSGIKGNFSKLFVQQRASLVDITQYLMVSDHGAVSAGARSGTHDGFGVNFLS
ncbi:hypothetical protein AV530_003025 [Patagioenas fasciata monilis]|uniref:Uncharacterized protein n=1 Tax=Patagioenas fasciata monilis TaxID=372326 RepID=A0A1V4KVZ9_PATFA|nr:hypothetical protein AV530_003025 [Patagioenas fasciata monilis]